ncbi:MFS transporter [Sphingomonas oligophenolica]|uniref:MFS transporter n=1 Tax=Sphingomonas oligophenolica TaxID=301154 RepID=A0ABU9YB35_9SPHN
MNAKTQLIASLWLLNFINALDRVAMGFAGPAIMKSLALSPSAFGIILSSFGVGYFLAQAPSGFLADRWGVRPLLIGGPILWALFTGMTGLVSTLASFVVVRFFFGISEGLTGASTYKAVGDAFEAKERARTLAICTTALAVAPAVAGPLMGLLVTSWGWQVAFFVLAMPSLITAYVMYRTVTARAAVPQADMNATPMRPPLWQTLKQPKVLLLAAATFAWNIPYWGFSSWMPTYLVQGRHLDLKSAGFISGVPYLFAFAGMIFGGWLGSRFHRYCTRIVTGAFIIAGGFLIFAYRADTVLLAVVGLSGAAFCLFGATGPIGKVGLDLAPEHQRGAFIGLIVMVGQVGAICAPAAIGFLVDWTHNFAAGFGFMIVALWAAAASYAVLEHMVKSAPTSKTV